MGEQDWGTTNLQTRLGSSDWSNPIASVQVPYNRGMAGGSGVTERKGSGGSQATAKSP